MSSSLLCRHFESLLANGLHSDVSFVVGDKSLSAHKAILAARSPVFAAMFEADHFKESREGQVKITDIPVEAFERMLRYIYTGQLPEMDRFATELMGAADKYELYELKSAAEQWLFISLTVDSVTDVLQFADLHAATKLKSHCADFIKDNAIEVMATDQWKALHKANMYLVNEILEQIVINLTKAVKKLAVRNLEVNNVLVDSMEVEYKKPKKGKKEKK